MAGDGDYDVIIIGSGAGGGTLARHLAPSGKRILILERGDWLPREIENWDSKEVFVENRYVPKETWFDEKGKPFQPGIHYCVGGATKMYGAALYRLRREDFGELRHHDGISPAWPISYDDMEPYYTKAEHLYEVHGNHGEDPTEPSASAPYPFPALTHEPRIQQLSDDLARAGYHPFHAPCGVRLLEQDRPNSLLHPLQDVRRVPVPRPGQVRRRDARRPSGARAQEREARHRRPRHAPRDRCGRDVGRLGDRRSRRDHRDVSRRHRRRVGGGRELRQDPARVGRRQAPGRAGQWLRHGRAPLHVPQQRRGPGDLQGAQPDAVPEDARRQRLLLRDARLRLPDGEHPDGRQVRCRDVQGREAAPDQARADVLPRPRWRRTRSTSGSRPRTCPTPTTG